MDRIFNECFLPLARTLLIVGASFPLASCSPISVAVRPQAQTVEAGGTATYDIDILRISYQGPVGLGVSPASSPHYSTMLQPNPVAGNRSQLSVQVAPGAPIGAYEIDVTSNPSMPPPLYGEPLNRANLVVGPCGARWIRQFGSAESDNAWSIKRSASGEIFTLAYQDRNLLAMRFDSDGYLLWADRIEDGTSGALDLDSQGKLVVAARITQNNMRQYQVRRYRPSGFLELTFTFGGNDPFIEILRGVATDGAGNIYLTGNTRGDLCGINPDRTHTNTEGWIAKYDPMGNLLWCSQTETFEHDFYYGIAVDNAGAVYVRGARRQNTLFLRKFDAGTGNEVWNEDIPVLLANIEGALAVDATGNVYVAFHRTLPSGLTDPVLMKYNTNKVQLWSEPLEAKGLSVPSGMAIDSAGAPIVVGRRILGSNQTKGAITKLDANGAAVWNLTIDAPFESGANSIYLDQAGEMYIVGDTNGHFGGQNRGRWDFWLGKLKQGGCVF